MADEDRPEYQSGVGTINGTSFHWGSGTPGKYWSIPYGDYPITPNAPTGAWAHQVGAIPINNNIIPDPVLHRNRVGIMIHPSSTSGAHLDQLYTQGCFAVAPQEWPAVKQQILAEASKGPLYLHVQPGQAAAFTHTPTLSQAGAPPASQSPPGTTITAPNAPVQGALANQGGGGFMRSVANIESNWRNIPSTVDKDYPGQPGSKSQGYWQIDTPTWQQFGQAAGIDLTKYPNAMSAPADIQEQVARQIPLSRFGGRTVKMLNQQYGGNLDKTATLGALDAKFGGGAPGAAAATASTGNTAPATAAAAPQQDQGWLGNAISKLTEPPTDKQGNPIAGAQSPLQQLSQGAQQRLLAEGQTAQDEAPQRSALGQGPGLRNVGAGAQTYGQTLNSFMQPLTWSNRPGQWPGMPVAGLQGAAAPQSYGMSLNSFQTPAMGLGYGIPDVGYGFG